LRHTYLTRLAREGAITVVFTYLLLVGGTLNGLALFEVITVSLVFLAVIGLSWLGEAWRQGRQLQLPRAARAYGIFLVAYGVSAAFSLDPRRSASALALTTLYALAWALVADLIAEGWPADMFVRVVMILGTILVGMALWQSIDHQLGWLKVRSSDQAWLAPRILRPHPFLTNTNMVAAFVNLLWPIGLVKLLSTKVTAKRAVLGIWTLLAWVALLLTSSRGGWVGATLALPVTTALWWLVNRTNTRAGLRAAESSHRARPKRWLPAVLALVVGVILAATYVLDRTSHTAGLESRRRFWVAAWRAFNSHPVLGLGPDTYVSAYLRHMSVPPGGLFVRAHSQVAHILAENGLLGLISGGALVTAMVRDGYARWRRSDATAQRMLAGVVGGLVATAGHGVFDTPQAIPMNSIVIATWAAILTSDPRRPPKRTQRLVDARALLSLLLICLTMFGVWSQYAYRPYLSGIDSAHEDRHGRAAEDLEKAAARDPHHAVYSLASAYVHGVLANHGDRSAATKSIARYERAIAKEPGYALHYANLASLHRQQGNTPAALDTMERAVDAAPQAAALWLNLGLYLEEAENLAGAKQAYHQVLELRKSWADAYYWRANEFRRAVLREERNVALPAESETPVRRAEEAMALSNYERALRLYDQALVDNPRWTAGHLGRARSLVALGRHKEASQAAGLASFGSGSDSTTGARITWTLAQIAHGQGDLGEASVLGEKALDVYRTASIFGPGESSTALYSWAVFYRLGPPQMGLPQLVTIRFPDEQVEWMVALGGWYEEKNDFDAARRVYEEALQAAPDTEMARQRLSTLRER